METFIEVGGATEDLVKSVSTKIGMNWTEAKFCAVDVLYSEKYNLATDQINNHTPQILFEMDNPFLK